MFNWLIKKNMAGTVYMYIEESALNMSLSFLDMGCSSSKCTGKLKFKIRECLSEESFLAWIV